MAYEEVELSRDVEVVMIPQGTTTVLTAGTPAVITQSLGDSFTLQVPTFGGLYRLSGKDAEARGIASGDSVQVSHNGTSVELRARVSRGLRPGIVRIATEHAGDLGGMVEVSV